MKISDRASEHSSPAPAVPSASPEPAPPSLRSRRLASQLVERYGSVALACESCGFGDRALFRWLSGGPCSPGTLQRLRDAVHAPVGRGLDPLAAFPRGTPPD